MLSGGACTPRSRIPMQEHWQSVGDKEGEGPRILLVAPGEKLCLVGSSGLADLALSEKTVEASNPAQRVISVELGTFEFGTVLALGNGFDHPFDYRALIKEQGRSVEQTSVCTVQAKLFGVEHWPKRLEMVAIGDFTPLENHAASHCR
jgi:hypothetical protein